MFLVVGAMHLLDLVDSFNHGVADITAEQVISLPVETAPERVAEPVRANLGQTCFVGRAPHCSLRTQDGNLRKDVYVHPRNERNTNMHKLRRIHTFVFF